MYEARLDGEQETVCTKVFAADGETKQSDINKEASINWVLCQKTRCVPRCFGKAKVEHGYSKNYLPHVIVLEMIKSGLKGHRTLSLGKLISLKPQSDLPKPIWSNLKKTLFENLDCVHKCGVVIGDISGDNIMVHWNGTDYIPYFIDMGIASYSESIIKRQEDIQDLKTVTNKFPVENSCCCALM